MASDRSTLAAKLLLLLNFEEKPTFRIWCLCIYLVHDTTSVAKHVCGCGRVFPPLWLYLLLLNLCLKFFIKYITTFSSRPRAVVGFNEAEQMLEKIQQEFEV